MGPIRRLISEPARSSRWGGAGARLHSRNPTLGEGHYRILHWRPPGVWTGQGGQRSQAEMAPCSSQSKNIAKKRHRKRTQEKTPERAQTKTFFACLLRIYRVDSQSVPLKAGEDWQPRNTPRSLPLREAVAPRPIKRTARRTRGNSEVSTWRFTSKTGTGTSAACKHPLFRWRAGTGGMKTKIKSIGKIPQKFDDAHLP